MSQKKNQPEGDTAVLTGDWTSMMLGDAGSNALGAVLGLESVVSDTRGRRIATIAALAGINVLGERVSLGDWIEQAPILSAIDRAGRV